MLVEQKGGLRQATVSSLGSNSDSSALEVQIRLAGGIGISVINSVPEELVFSSLEQIEVQNPVLLFILRKVKCFREIYGWGSSVSQMSRN